MKEEALKLADELENTDWWQNHEANNITDEASTMIRRLVEELDKQKEIDGVFDYYCDENIRSKQTKPLSDEEISQVYKEVSEPFGEKRLYEIHDFARAIEERHGIE